MGSQFYEFMLGDFQCIAISDGSGKYKLDEFFSNVVKEEVETVLRHHKLPVEHIISPFTCLFVDTGGRRVLVDMGAGRLTPPAPPGEELPPSGTLLQNMRAAGIEPADIDAIIITHAHPDHIGGSLDEADKPIYPNARYYIWKDEWDFWTSESASTTAPDFFVSTARKYLGPFEDCMTLLTHETEIVPGIHAIATPGHTPGHMALSISSLDEQLIHVSDAVLHPLHLEHPDWLPLFDMQPQQAAASKHSIFNRAAVEQALVFAHHFPPFPNLGHVVRRADSWEWQPIEITD